MGIDDCTKFKKNLEYDCIFIASSCRSMVDKAISVKINGIIFDIHVTEERASCCHHNSMLGPGSTTCSSGDRSSSESGYSWLDKIYEENVGSWVSEEEDDDVAVENQQSVLQATTLVPDPKLMDQLGPDLSVFVQPLSPELASELIS
ncbi:unnamed protein product [Lupinus luteus]|uniref:Uncharacterized protein n=1 Tax=Lupinus luteus TaxID=3873 RepID=A0AAV1Y0P0_LUPLU